VFVYLHRSPGLDYAYFTCFPKVYCLIVFRLRLNLQIRHLVRIVGYACYLFLLLMFFRQSIYCRVLPAYNQSAECEDGPLHLHLHLRRSDYMNHYVGCDYFEPYKNRRWGCFCLDLSDLSLVA